MNFWKFASPKCSGYFEFSPQIRIQRYLLKICKFTLCIQIFRETKKKKKWQIQRGFHIKYRVSNCSGYFEFSPESHSPIVVENFQVYFIHTNFQKNQIKTKIEPKSLYCDATIFLLRFFIVFLPKKKWKLEKWPKAVDSPKLIFLYKICIQQSQKVPSIEFHINPSISWIFRKT